MQHEKFQIYTLEINTIVWHYKINSDYFWLGCNVPSREMYKILLSFLFITVLNVFVKCLNIFLQPTWIWCQGHLIIIFTL